MSGPVRVWARVAAVVALGVLVAVWSPNYAVMLAAAVALPIVAGRHAPAVVVFLAVTAREAPDGRGFAAVTRLGAQIYYEGKVPAIDLLALSAIAVALVRLRRRGDRPVVRRVAWVLLGILAALAVLAFALGIVYGQSAFSAANQNSRNFVAVALGVAIGLLIVAFPEEIRAVQVAAVTGLGVLVLAAAYAVATGQAADDRVSRYFTYYDSALPAVAIAVFGALLVARSRLTRLAGLAMGLSVTLVLIGFRVTIWLAAAVVLVLVVVLSREWTAVARRAAISALALGLGILILPGMRSDITERLVGASSVAPSVAPTPSTKNRPATTAPASPARPSAGPPRTASAPPALKSPVSSALPAPKSPISSASPARKSPVPVASPSRKPPPKAGGQDVAAESSQGHLEDIRVAWSAVRKNFWTGIGPQHPQLPGLASDRTTVLYVHNEWLQDWLRFGPGAVLLVTAFLLVVAWLSVRTLAGRSAPALHRAAAVFGLITPITLLAFPYFSDSAQWPLLLGIAAGILAAAQTPAAQTPASGDSRAGEPSGAP
ncbi:hypothetical protein ACQP1P_04975 [Dactylosporangium sp. CA-052675]|uniref:hypothetical protein n=1 Tax=Dactylosporangium sp. CA-052675 TaxID=3239927 RepID=UPI003D89C0D2